MNATLASLIILLAIPLIFVGAFVNALVGSYLYFWFLVPLGLPVLSLGHFYGLLLLKAVVWAQPLRAVKSDTPGTDFVASLIAPFLALGVGYIVQALVF